MEIISLREFARRIGVSLPAVQKAARPENGRIQVIRDAAGKITGIDWDSQQTAWTENSKAPQKRPHNIGGGRPRNDGQPPAAPRQKRHARQEGEVSEYLEPQAHGGALKRAETEPPPPGEMSITAIQRARELVKLQIDNENLKKIKGDTVPVAEVKAQGAKLAGALISALYNIPERVSDDIAGMSDPHAINELLVREIDAAVADIRKLYGR